MTYFSIILSVYNGEKYIRRALQSILDQTFDGYEAIIIDDGSTDRTGKICKELTGNDSRFQYYYQDNQGISLGRSNGVKKASGEYILFLDADDYFTINCLEHLRTVTEVKQYDVIEFGRNGKSRFVEDTEISPQDELKEYLQTGNTHVVLWRRCYRKNAIRYDMFPLRYCQIEDEFTYPVILANAESMVVLSESLYNHDMSNTESLMHLHAADKEKSWERAMELAVELPRHLQSHIGDKATPHELRCHKGRVQYNFLVNPFKSVSKNLKVLATKSGSSTSEILADCRYSMLTWGGKKEVVVRIFGIYICAILSQIHIRIRNRRS